MSERITREQLVSWSEWLAQPMGALVGLGALTELRLIAEVRRLQGLIVRCAPVDERLTAETSERGAHLHGPIVTDLVAEARTIREEQAKPLT